MCSPDRNQTAMAAMSTTAGDPPIIRRRSVSTLPRQDGFGRLGSRNHCFRNNTDETRRVSPHHGLPTCNLSQEQQLHIADLRLEIPCGGARILGRKRLLRDVEDWLTN